MHISGIVVRAVPERTLLCVDALTNLAGIDVDRFDLASGSIVVVQETATREEQEAGLRHIQQLPGVASAELVCHFVEPATQTPPDRNSADVESAEPTGRNIS